MGAFLFGLKKLLGILLSPICLVLLLAVAGAVLKKSKRRRKLGTGLIIASFALLFILSLPATGWLLLHPLESSAGDYADPAKLASLGVRDLVVLSGGVMDGDRVQSDRLGFSSLSRVLEGIRLYKALPGSRIIMSGGAPMSQRKAGKAMAALALELGVSKDRLLVEGESWDTQDQALALQEALQNRPFALITSASHMSRAMYLFEKQGLNPIAAPTNFYTREFENSFRMFLPQTSGINASKMAIYEYLGHLWVRLKALFT